MLHFYNIAFLFFHEYIHRFGVNKLKHTALEAEGKSYRGEHRGTEGEGGRPRLHSSTLHTAATDVAAQVHVAPS